MLWPPVRRMWEALGAAQWSQALSLQVQSGLSIAEALKLASHVRQESNSLSKKCKALYEGLVGGETLNEAMREQQFPPLLVEMVKVGEETGTLGRMLDWSARHFEDQFESSIEQMLSLLEPIIMMFLGLVTGLMMLLTMLPMVKAVQSL